MPDDDDALKIPPSVPLQSATAARIQAEAEKDAEIVQSQAQTVIAHVRSLESQFMAALGAVASSPELDRARTLMMEARQWVITHFTT